MDYLDQFNYDQFDYDTYSGYDYEELLTSYSPPTTRRNSPVSVLHTPSISPPELTATPPKITSTTSANNKSARIDTTEAPQSKALTSEYHLHPPRSSPQTAELVVLSPRPIHATPQHLYQVPHEANGSGSLQNQTKKNSRRNPKTSPDTHLLPPKPQSHVPPAPLLNLQTQHRHQTYHNRRRRWQQRNKLDKSSYKLSKSLHREPDLTPSSEGSSRTAPTRVYSPQSLEVIQRAIEHGKRQ